MRIAVVGLGGVGGYIGAKLCALKEEHEIIFITREPDLIEKNGLTLIDVDDENIYYPTEVASHYSKPLDVIFLCTKSYQSIDAVHNLSTAITEDTVLIPISNGVNNQELIQSETNAKVVDACVYIVSHQLSKGVIKKSTDKFALILPDLLQEKLEIPLEKAGIRVKFAKDIKKEIWKKFLFISAMGNLTSYYEKGMGRIYQEHEEELSQVFSEIFSLAKIKDINIEKKEIDKALKTAASLPLDAPTSLWLDFQKKSENELDALSGYVVHEAKKEGVDTPLMKRMYQKLSIDKG